jgi:hypothetical protein
MTIRIGLINVLQGLKFTGTHYSETKIGGSGMDEYINLIKKHSSDILCVNELVLDDGKMLDQLMEAGNYKYCSSCIDNKAWLVKDRYYGSAILSKFPITKQDSFELPNPKIEIDRPNGEHWILHDKIILQNLVTINGYEIYVSTFQYFPFHHFNRDITSVEFIDIRQKLAQVFQYENSIIAADFNHMGHGFNESFPEIINSGFIDSFKTKTTLVGESEQTDHIIYKGKHLKAINGTAVKTVSDHYYIETTFDII